MATATIADTTYLRAISGAEVELPACDGAETIANDARKLFTAWIDPDFKNYGASESGPPTPTTWVRVFEMTKDADFQTMFGSISRDTDKLCLTQHQIIEFVRNHEDLLHPSGWAEFFLFKSKGKFFVASVYRFGVGRFEVDVNHFEDNDVWCADGRYRLVVPKMAP